ncbi:MAG: multifunctional 2-oxoglutarate metabolism enzyme, partial [Thermoleophilaceae bacterium]|nr:multifunctional 2-oxoglutarate metabolism enzyme [Thermoleophilaceae bacterium]
MSGFGANEWLVDEMYERYQKDPNSVDKVWWDFFGKDQRASAGSSDSSAADGSSNGSRATSNGSVKESTGAPKSRPSSGEKSAKVESKPETKKPESKESEPKKAEPKKAEPAAKQEAKAEKPAKTSEKEKESSGRKPTPKDPEKKTEPEVIEEPTYTVLKGAPARTVANMDASLTVPTATSVRSVPVKLLWDNRIVINNHLARARGGKVSFTHLIGYALVKALKSMPEMNVGFDVIDGKPTQITPAHVNLGLAIDLPKPDGTRTLLVPSIKAAETMDFAHFWTAYEDLIRKARNGKLAVTDFQGTSISLTNPGTIGTNHSVPRLMKGQGAIIGVGSMEYPPEFQGASEETLTRNAISKIMTLTSTYDHRVIQGAQSGEFLKRMHGLLLGEDNFYDEIFRALRIPYEPIRWSSDISTNHDDEISKQARILELIHAYRVRGHMMADTDPLEYRQRSHPDLEVESHGLTLWDLDREFATGSFGGERRFMKMRSILG